MTVRVVEGKKPYTGGEAINIDENKVISLRLRDENNLIIYDEGDDEIYVDLQLPDGIKPLDAFPVGITTGRVLVADDWDKTGTIICAKTTSGDNIKLLYADDGTLWIDNGTGIFKQLYFKADVDLIIQAIQTQIDALSGLGRFLSLWDGETGEPISFPLSVPYEYHTGDWFMINVVDNTTNYRPDGSEFDGTASTIVETQATEIGDVYIYDGTTWLLQKNGGGGGSAVLFSQVLGNPYDNTNLATALNDKQDTLIAGTNITIDSSTNTISATAGSDIVYATQAEYTALLPGAESDGKHYFIYTPNIISVTGVTLDESTISLTTPGDTYQLTATVSPNNATDKSVNWSSSDNTIATVDNTGLVTCVTPGTCTITVTTTDGGFTATCGVNAGWQPGANTLAYYPLTSITTVNDLSGNNNNGTNISSVTFGDVGGVDCATFGSGSKISLPGFGDFTNLTVSVWFKATTSASNTQIISIAPTTDNKNFSLCLESGTCKLVRYTGTDGYTISDGVLTDGNWHNVIGTYSSTLGAVLYVDGVYIGADATVTDVSSSSGYTYIGGHQNTASIFRFTGNISNVILEDKIWTATDVTNYFNQTKADYGIS